MILLSVLAIMCVVVFALLAWTRSGRRWRVGLVECFRVVLVSIAVWILWQPETTYQIESDRKLDVVVLVDRSASMQTRDVQGTRRDVADQIIADAAWERLDDRFQRVVELFAESDDQTSDLGSALEATAQRHDSAVAFVLVSDGDWNHGRPPVETAARIATSNSGASNSGSRVDSISIGDADRLPDIELVSADVPTFGVTGKPVRIPFTIRNWFGDLREVTATIQVDDVVVDQQTIPIREGGRFDGSFIWQSDETGEFTLRIDVPVISGESNQANNQLTKTIEIRAEKLRVLIIESTPRWEYRYLRNALLRDPGIDVSCLLFHPGLGAVGGGGTDYLSVLPEDAAELASYDVVFLGDVGVSPEQLTVQQCHQIRGLVEQQAVGLVLMPGPRGGQSSLLQSDLSELFPVVLDPAKPRGVGSDVTGSFSLTNSGRRSLLTELADDDQTNWSVWESLPGFYWHAGVVRAKAGSDVLAVHAESSNQYGRLPLLVTRSAGAGKVLYMGTDAAWRWRMGVEDKYHYRFWGQVIRWMAYQRTMAVGETIRLSYRPEQPAVGETVSLRASVMTSTGVPSQEQAVWVEVVSPDGSRDEIRLASVDSEWGVYIGQTQFDQIGEYKLTLKHPTEKSTVQARLAVQGRAVEQIGRPARPDVMQEIANAGGGQMYASNQLGNLVDQLNSLPPDPSTVRRIEWWNHPAVMLAMVCGLTLFWVGRKWAGVV